jgi:hypothetical protein
MAYGFGRMAARWDIDTAEEKNAENLLVIRDAGLAGKYVGNWKDHAGHSEGVCGAVIL